MWKSVDNTTLKIMKNNRQNRNNNGGFTLIEVMIVLFILVMLASMAIVTYQGQQKMAQKRAAFTCVKMLAGAVERYTMDIGRPPGDLSSLLTCPSGVPEGKWGGPYIKAEAKSTDPWGNEYQYAYPGKKGEFDIWSYGPDMMDGTDDDIGSWMNDI